MSKGTIKTNLGDGQYTVTLNYDRARVTDAITVLDGRIADLTAKIEEMEEGTQKSMAQLQLTALEKKKAFLEDPNNVIPDEDINAYCADLTTDLTGEVGVIDIPGEGQHFNIQPGYEGNAVYDADRDGQFQHVWGGTPSSVFYNLAMLPGWQKWRPTYRYGTVSNLSGDTCDVTLDAAISTQQSLGVNQAETLTGVTIEYMSCNGAAFENGDEVIVKFEDQDWTKPKVIGFKEEPAACCCWSMIFPTTVDHTLTHISCYDGAPKVPPTYCSMFWSNLQFTDAGLCGGNFIKPYSLQEVSNVLKFEKREIEQELPSEGNSYFILDLSWLVSWTCDAIPATPDGMYVRHRMSFTYNGDTQDCTIQTIGAYSHDITKTYSGSGVYYWNIWEALEYREFGPVHKVGDVYVDTEGYSLFSHFIEFWVERGSGSMTGSIALTMNSLEICSEFPDGAIELTPYGA